MLVSDISKRVMRQFGDEAGVQIDDSDIIRWVNDAQKEISSANSILETSSTMNTIAGTNTYVIPTTVQDLFTVWFNGTRLDPMTMREAEEEIAKVGDTTYQPSADPVSYWIWAGTMYLWPVPSTVGVLKLFYSRFPIEVTAVTDTPELDPKYHKTIVDYCLQQAYELDEDWTASQAKAQQVQESLGTFADDEKWTVKNTYPTVTVLTNDLW